MRRVWKNYGLGIAFIGLFVVSEVLQTWTGWMHYAAQQAEHGQSAQWFGQSGYIWDWGSATFSNWQADALGQGFMIILGAYLLYKGSQQSKDGSDRIEQLTQQIQQRLEGKSGVGPGGKPARAEAAGQGFWRNYGLAIPLMLGFLVSIILFTWMGWNYFVDQQTQHHQVATVFGSSGYLWYWGVQVWENWQSNFLWQGITIITAAYLIYQGSSVSKDSDDRVEQMLQEIQKHLGQQPSQPEAAPQPGTIVAERVQSRATRGS